jgi:anti-sigma regulatory factor (Ser/Thr protein kinase)
MIDSLTLAVSELVTNAVLHARSSTLVTLVNCDDAVQVRVQDEDPHSPNVRDTDLESLHGRGLQLVGEVSDQWGVQPAPPGKIVWLDITKH